MTNNPRIYLHDPDREKSDYGETSYKWKFKMWTSDYLDRPEICHEISFKRLPKKMIEKIDY